MNLIILISSIFATYSCCVNGQSCTTPNGMPGNCKMVNDCQPLLEILLNTFRTPQELEFLQRSQCGFQGNTPTVCCANPTVSIPKDDCFNSDGNQGKCVDIYQCKHLAEMLKPPVSQQNIIYLQKSKCKGPTQYSVCCASTVKPLNQDQQTCNDLVSAYPPDPTSDCCGIDSRVGNKIVGGHATTVDQYPWLALIDYIKDGVIKQLCGGVLISGKYVLTAAHCVTGDVLNYGTPHVVRLSEYDKSKDGPDCAIVEAGGEDCTEDVLKVPIELTIPHPNYNAGRKSNDIALIRLANMAPFTDFIRPICLPTVDWTLNPPFNFTMYAAGWGAVSTKQSSSNVKLHVALPFVNQQQCQIAYNAPGLRATLWHKQLCAGGQKDKDSCKGDSGGPLMFENNRTFEAVGVVSFGPVPCGIKNTPGVYTKVFEYKQWILSNIKP